MSRPLYDVKELYTGTGSLASYTFDFKIGHLTHLLIVVVDDDGVEVERVRGDDTSFLDEVTFDAVNGGGTVDLLAPLPSDYTIIILLADDEPAQEYEFRNKTSFTLRRFEDALDAISGATQRLAYLAKQSLRIHDIDDESVFDNQLPSGVADQGEKLLRINTAGDGFDYGPNWNDIPTAQATADAALAAAQAAQATADSGVTSADVAQDAADDAQAAAVAAQEAADEAQAAADDVALALGELQTDVETAQETADAITALIVPAFVTTQSVAAAGTITVDLGYFQNRKVQGNGAARITANAPFGTSFISAQDGMRVLLVGKNAVNTLTLPYYDGAWGVLLNGDCVLGLNQTVELILDYSAQRFYEISRNF